MAERPFFASSSNSGQAGISPLIFPDFIKTGGETGIRTLGRIASSIVFETTPFDHSGISPKLHCIIQIIINNIISTKIYGFFDI